MTKNIPRDKETSFRIREIVSEDNGAVAHIIKEVMTSFQCVGEGYSINDPELSDMYAAYGDNRSRFYVVEEEGVILGCGGVAPLAGGDQNTCELKKMYFLSQLRGKGMGRILLELCLSTAKELGYKKCYLETVERMDRANVLYAKSGFKKLGGQEGATGHSGCDTFYVKEL